MLNFVDAQCHVSDGSGVLDCHSACKGEAVEPCIGMYSNINSVGFQNGNRASFVGFKIQAPAIIRVVGDCNRPPNFHVEVRVAACTVGRAIHSLVGTGIHVILPHIIKADSMLVMGAVYISVG